MSNDKKIMSTAAAPASINDAAFSNFNNRPPPPSYEESQRMYASASNQFPTPFMQTSNYNATSNYMQSYTTSAPPPQYYQHHYVTATAPPTFNSVKEPHVLSLAPGAKIRTTAAGAVSIPPPPPGCAPTAAQYAAMQGQPVVLKKTKRSFF
uniref:DAZ-associated protein 2 n=1 Tax=Bactrocera latifrons TaxID=174628 RepID=A0A0K8UW77_BACLA